jgi:hypothetical protein
VLAGCTHGNSKHEILLNTAEVWEAAGHSTASAYGSEAIGKNAMTGPTHLNPPWSMRSADAQHCGNSRATNRSTQIVYI